MDNQMKIARFWEILHIRAVGPDLDDVKIIDAAKLNRIFQQETSAWRIDNLQP